MSKKESSRLLRAYEENKQNGYIICSIDWERCLGQEIGDYLIEVSGLSAHGNRKFNVHIFLWEKRHMFFDFAIRQGSIKDYGLSCERCNREMYFDTKDECFAALQDVLLKIKQRLEEKVKNKVFG